MMATVGHQPPLPQQPTTQQTTQLEFTQAMRDFKTMFPEMDEDVIEVVLRANQGAVDATIDQLLAMSTDNENERLRTEMDATENAEAPPGYSPTTPPPTYQQAVPYSQLSTSPAAGPVTTNVTPPTTTSASSVVVVKMAATCTPAPASQPTVTTSSDITLPSSSVKSSQSSASSDMALATMSSSTDGPLQASKSDLPLRVQKNWAPPILGPLPCDFLRISLPNGRLVKAETSMTTELWSEVILQKIEENKRQRKLGHSEDPELTQYLEDERIALFLQNEEFMKELRSNKDFLTTLERDTRSGEKAEGEWLSSCNSDEDETDSETEAPPKEAIGAFPYTKPFPTEESDAAFREKLKNMGKMSRRKFAQLARLFSRQRKRSAKQILSEGSMPSKDNLLLDQDENEYGSESDEEDPSKPQNEYHLIKHSSSPSHHNNSGSSSSKHD